MQNFDPNAQLERRTGTKIYQAPSFIQLGAAKTEMKTFPDPTEHVAGTDSYGAS
jgi:hypothetical protein